MDLRLYSSIDKVPVIEVSALSTLIPRVVVSTAVTIYAGVE